MYRRNIKKVISAATAALLTVSLIGCQPRAVGETEYPVEITAINVGKADAILVSVNGLCYLIDSGTKDSFDKLWSALGDLGVQSLEGVFLTHTDKDHGGGMEQLAETDMPVGAWYAPAIYHEKKARKHQAFIAADIRGTEVLWLNAGDAIQIDEFSRFEVFAPLVVDEQVENNNSLVMKLITPEGTALFAGDLEKDGEPVLLASGVDLKSDYLKVANHGDADASGAIMIAAVSPRVAVISTNTAEKNDTPAPEVLQILRAAGAQVYVTQDYELGVRVRLIGGQAVVTADDAA